MGVRFPNIKTVVRNVKAIRFLYGLGFKNGHIELFMDFSDYKWTEIFNCKFDF